ncbi:MAG: YbaB/EbfC family nucleoid-associated protein [Umezawaea sp.]
MIDPEQVLRGYEDALVEATRKSEAIREGMANLLVTERSADGQISVTVNDAGNLVDLKLGNALQSRDGAAVGQEVLRVVRAAQGRIATAVQEAMAPLLGGEDSEAMRFMVDRLRSAEPAPEQPSAGWGAEHRFGSAEDEAPRYQPPPPPPRRPEPRDDDFGDGGFLR